MGALAATLLPGAVGLGLLGLLPWLGRRFGAATASAFAARAALTAAVLAILLLWGSVRRDQLEHRLGWLHVGHTTTIDWLVQLDPLGLLLAGGALLALVLGAIAGLAVGSADGGMAQARSALATGGALVLATAGSGWQLGLGAAAIVMACQARPIEMSDGACFNGHVSGGRWPLGAVGLGLAVAGIAWLVAAGDLELATLERAALGEERSQLVRGQIGGPFGAAAPGVIAAVGVGLAALGWALAWPRLVSRPWAEGPAGTLVMMIVGLPALGIVLVRTHVPLALAPTTLAVLTTLGAGLAGWAGLRAARARSTEAALVASAQVVVGVAISTVAIGDPVAGTQLLIAGGLGSGAMIAGLGSGRAVRAVIAGIAGIGLVGALGAGVAALASDMSAWSWGINAAAPGLALVGVAGLAASVFKGFVFLDRVEGTGWAPAEAGGLLAGVGVALALAAGASGLWPLGEWLWPQFMAGRALSGAFALGPGPEGMVFGTGVGAVLVIAAAGLGVALARRIGPAPERLETAGGGGADGATLGRLLRVVERVIEGVTLWPGDERVAVAPGRFDVRVTLLAATAGTLAIVGSVLCNPDVLVLGPTRIHPVDLGGLDAAMAGARRAAPTAPATSVRPQGAAPEEAELGPVPLMEIEAAGEDVVGEPRDMLNETGSEEHVPVDMTGEGP